MWCVNVFLQFFFPCPADHEPDWQPRAVFFLFVNMLMLFSHYADWAGPQPRLWFAEQGKKTKGNSLTHHIENRKKKRKKENHSHEPRKIRQRTKKEKKVDRQ